MANNTDNMCVISAKYMLFVIHAAPGRISL